MNRIAHPPELVKGFLLFLCFGLFLSGTAQVLQLPFSGIYGATAGAGSITGGITGTERHGGDNPAVIAAPGWSAAVAGYAPFGLDGLRAMEVEASRDAPRWGASLGLRALFDEAGPGTSRWSAQGAWKPRENLSLGGVLRVHAPYGNPGIGAGAGALWHPHPVLALGAAWESSPDPVRAGASESRVAIGAAAGWEVGARRLREPPRAGERSGFALRTSVECFLHPHETIKPDVAEWRFGLGLRFHPLLSVHAGFSPRHQTAALGVRFGMGDWEGFSALRRHAALGGTSIQGLRWGRVSP